MSTRSTAPIRVRLMRGGAWAVGGKVVTAGAALCVNALLARLLTPGHLGAYYVAVSLLALAGIIAQLGLNEAGIRFAAASLATGRGGRARGTLYAVLGYGLAASSILSAFLLLGPGEWVARRVFDAPALAAVVGIAACLLPVLTLRSLVAEMFRGLHRIELATIFGEGSTTVVLAVLLTGVVVMSGASTLGGVLVLTLLAGLLVLIGAAAVLRRQLTKLNGARDLPGRELLTASWPLMISGLLAVVLMEGGVAILGSVRPEHDVALYGTAARMAGLLTFPLLIVNAVIAPLVVELHTLARSRTLERLLRDTATLATVAAGLGTVVVLFAGEWLLGWVFGPYYRSAAGILVVLALAQLANVAAGSAGLVLAMTGHQLAVMKITAMSVVIMVAGSLLLADALGPEGVAFSVAAGLGLQNLLLVVAVRRRLGIWSHARLTWHGVRTVAKLGSFGDEVDSYDPRLVERPLGVE